MMFKPKRISINRTWFVSGQQNIYSLRVSNGKRISSGSSASTSFYGNKKYISKIFHALIKELGLPKDRLDWKQIDMGKHKWEF